MSDKPPKKSRLWMFPAFMFILFITPFVLGHICKYWPLLWPNFC